MAIGHHVLYEKYGWEAKGRGGVERPASKLRRMGGLIIAELANTPEHDDLHKAIGHIVVPGYLLANSILRNYEDTPSDPLRSIHSLIDATHYAKERSGITPVEELTADLLILGVEAQLPYIKAVL